MHGVEIVGGCVCVLQVALAKGPIKLMRRKRRSRWAVFGGRKYLGLLKCFKDGFYIPRVKVDMTKVQLDFFYIPPKPSRTPSRSPA